MTILNTIELTKTAPIVDGIFISCIALFILGFIIAFTVSTKYAKIGTTLAAIAVASFLGAFICAGLKDDITVPSGEVHYEVLINDDTSFTEVIEKYDIIEQRGEIFVLEEKE